MFMMSQNANKAAADKQKEEKAESTPPPAKAPESKFQNLTFDNSALPSAIAGVSESASSSSNLMASPSASGKATSIGAKLQEATDEIESLSSTGSAVLLERTTADIKKGELETAKQILVLTEAAQDEIDKWKARRKAKAETAAEAVKPETMTDKLAKLPGKDTRSPARVSEGEKSDKLNLDDITPIDEAAPTTGHTARKD